VFVFQLIDGCAKWMSDDDARRKKVFEMKMRGSEEIERQKLIECNKK
jgi:hypothetical protein